MRDIVTGLDIGTSKICAAIAEVGSGGNARIRGIGLADAKGINKGFVSNLDKLIDSINKAVSSAEDEAGLRAHNVMTNISGASVTGKISEGLIPLARRGREITSRDIRKVIEMTKDLSLSLEKDFLYSSPQEFMVDDNDGVENPLGLFGTKLKVKLYVITALANHIQNISKAVNYSGCELLDIVPTTVAQASGMLRDNEKSSGAIIIDVGGGVTELAIFCGGMLRFFDTVNVGGMDLTACLSAHFKIPFENAEMIKRKYANISKEDLKKNEKNIFDIEDKHIVIAGDVMNNLLKERFDEIFYILKDRLKNSTYFTSAIPSLIVTGGGALLNGALEHFEDLFKIPVKIGRINDVAADPSRLSNPVHSAAIGLAKYGIDKYARTRYGTFKGKSFLTDTFFKLKEMLEEYF